MSQNNNVSVDAVDLFKHIESRAEPAQLTVVRGEKDAAPVLVVPSGQEIRSVKALLDEYRTVPERRTGTASLVRAADFIAHVNRFKGDNTALFVDPSAPAISAIYDYHPAGGDVFVTANAAHRAHHAFPVSRQFKAWKAISGKTLPQADFASFLTEHAVEVCAPSNAPGCAADLESHELTVGTADVLRRLAKGLRLTVAEEVEDVHALDSGDCVISFARKTTSTRDAKGEEVKVPGGFVVAMPILDGDTADTALPAILRHDRRGTAVVWTITLLHVEQTLAQVVDAAVARITAATGCPVFYGVPEIRG